MTSTCATQAQAQAYYLSQWFAVLQCTQQHSRTCFLSTTEQLTKVVIISTPYRQLDVLLTWQRIGQPHHKACNAMQQILAEYTCT